MAKDSGPSTALLVTLAAAGPAAASVRQARRQAPGSPAMARLASAAARPGRMPRDRREIPAAAGGRSPSGCSRLQRRPPDDRGGRDDVLRAAGHLSRLGDAGVAVWPGGRPGAVNEQLNAMQGVLPSGGFDIIAEQVKSLTSNGKQALGFGLVDRAADVALDVEPGHQGAVRRAERGLPREGEARLHRPHLPHAGLHPRRAAVRHAGDGCGRGRRRSCSTSSGSVTGGPRCIAAAALAGADAAAGVLPGSGLPLRPEPAAGALAMGELGQRFAAVTWLSPRSASRTTSPISAATTRPTGRWAPRSAS